jgi:SAM-dependent methyltransferase
MDEPVVYAGRDLEAMSFARNYHRWILELFEPYLGTRIVEVGAGTGSFSELILTRPVETLSLVEPSREMYRLLVENVRALQTTARIETYNAVFGDVAERIGANERPDSIIYVNVLEHIADDEAELRAIHRTLAERGRVFIFVPALRWLYGSLDREIGHHRRYTRPELLEKCRGAGFRVLKSTFFDSTGVLPWWIKYRLLGSRTMEPGVVKLYDRFAVPLVKRMEALVSPPIGKSLLLVAEKD